MVKPKRRVPGGTEKARQRALGGRILAFRERRGLSRLQLAESVGVTVSAISALERGERWPSLSTLLSLANALQTTTFDLLEA